MSLENGSPPEEVEDEVAALIITLHKTGKRLEELTGGEVDTVSTESGQPFLLRRAQRDRRNVEGARQAAILNALPAQIALLDANGIIVSVNDTWREFTGANLLEGPAFAVGVNYLEICDRATGADSAEAQQAADGIRSVLTTAQTFSLEYSCHARDARRWFSMTVTPLPGVQMHGAVVMHVEITDRIRAAAAFEALSQKTAQRERLLTTTLSALHDFAYIYDRAGRFLFANQPLLNLWGLTLEEVVGKDFFDLGYPPEIARRLQQQVQEVFETSHRITDEAPYTNPRGVEGFYEYIFSPAFGADGTVEYVVGSTRDITERKLAEKALRESNAKFLQLAANITDAFWIRSPDMREVQYLSPAFEKIWGRSVASLQAAPLQWSEFVFAEDRQRVRDAFSALTSAARSLDIEYRIVRPDGELRWVRVRGFQVRDATDRLLRHIGIVTDITEQRRLAAELETKRMRLIEAQAVAKVGSWETDLATLVCTWSEETHRIFATDPAVFTATHEGFLQLVHPGDREPVAQAFLRSLPQPVPCSIEHRILLPDGTIRFVEERWLTKLDERGQPSRVTGTCQDITERKLATEALRVSEKHFKALFEQAAVGVAQTDATTGRFVLTNQRFCEFLGRSREELELLTFAAVTHPHDVSDSLEMMSQMKAGLLREFSAEKRYLRKDGSEVWASVTVAAMWAAGDEPDYFIAVVQDMTGRKKLEEQFRQSQKMDAIGTLAGGIAHDFNNILAAINGYTELSRMQLTGNPEVRGYLGAVLQASGRATELVRQILTFSRQQKVERRPIQLQPVLTEAFKLLRASIPSTIEFDISLKDAPVVLADATQVHQVLMNLGTNAWHAMKDRPGKLQVKLERCVVDAPLASDHARLSPGDYARLSVSDTGSGMDQETLKRIFEPFFTTKAIGEGTGLGLAVVHGIMANHDGAVTAYSEPGQGTVFHLYFPAVAGAPTAALELGPVPRGHGERILFVDDEELLVKLAEQTLTELGYNVEITTQPGAALAMVRADPQRFALVLTDQTMPGMTGVDLARQLLQLRPGLPIILLTGYGLSLTPERIKAAGIRQLLLKPTTILSLGSAVHAALSASPGF